MLDWCRRALSAHRRALSDQFWNRLATRSPDGDNKIVKILLFQLSTVSTFLQMSVLVPEFEAPSGKMPRKLIWKEAIFMNWHLTTNLISQLSFISNKNIISFFYVTLRRMKITYFGAESLFMVSSWVSVKADLKREEENNIQHYTRKRFEYFLKWGCAKKYSPLSPKWWKVLHFYREIIHKSLFSIEGYLETSCVQHFQ